MDEVKPEGETGHKAGVSRLSILLLVLLIANLGFLVFLSIDVNLQTSRLNREIEILQFQLKSTQSELASLRDEIKIRVLSNASETLQLTRIYNETRMSVVLIRVRTLTGSAQGSGFVYDNEGRIITNNHVVEGASSIEVTFPNGVVAKATLVGRDPYADLAVIQVKVDPSLLRPLKLGSSSELLVGEPVVAIGNPYGLANTVTFGIVSAVGRQIEAPGGYAIVDVIQTDAAINPGNSGGPLLNMRGEVVGMNTAIVSTTGSFSGIGFAVPSDTIKREVPSLVENGTYQHPYLGIRGMDVTPSIAEAMGLDGGTRGALVVDVVEGGPAHKAGLKGGTMDLVIDGARVRVGGDIIIGVEGREVRSFYDLVVHLERYHRPGDTIRLNVIRGRGVVELMLTLGVRPPPS
ncbi:MAG: trypsin-like peptidase domain-containing protein [Candidatus Bathyarchaeia archaeon]|nr:trypsin-like peptidase domain-containing protein [Candidatus Bathyarchaeota archaeon]